MLQHTSATTASAIIFGISYLALMGTGITFFACRNASASRKRFWFFGVYVSCTGFVAAAILGISKHLTVTVVMASAAVPVALWIAALILEARRPMDWSKPSRFLEQKGNERLLRAAVEELINNGVLSPEQRAALTEAIAASDRRLARLPAPTGGGRWRVFRPRI